jgi:hypothetical protein
MTILPLTCTHDVSIALPCYFCLEAYGGNPRGGELTVTIKDFYRQMCTLWLRWEGPDGMGA